MTSSYEKIDYRIRPAKSIERKMLCDAFRKLTYFKNVKQYQYIGMGSIYFSDFYITHKMLGIKNMISIEKDAHRKDRFEFNCPYQCIKIEYGLSNEILPKIELNKPTILWLDYDRPLKIEMITDISTFVSSTVSGSVLVVTIDAQPDNIIENTGENYIDNLKRRFDELLKRIGRSRMPPSVSYKDMTRDRLPKVYRRIIDNVIKELLSDKNSMIEDKDKINYKQLFNFIYSDGAQMFTLGGIIYAERDKKIVKKCNFNSLEFIRTAESPCKIVVPKITYREKNSLDKIMPLITQSSKSNEEQLNFLSQEEKNEYSKIYRYFPSFVEAEL